MYRTITRHAILHNVQINGKTETCVYKILVGFNEAERAEILEKEQATTGDTSLYLGISHWEEWV